MKRPALGPSFGLGFARRLLLLAALGPTVLIACKRAPAPLPPAAAPAAKAPADARLTAVRGAVEIERAGKITVATAQAALFAGDLLRTGAASDARLAFANGQTVHLRERALLRLGRDAGSSLELAIIVGEADVEGAGGLQIATPHGPVRLAPGGRLRVKALSDRTHYEVMVGRASMAEGDAGALTLTPGDGLSIAIGGSVLERYHVQLGATEVEQVESGEADKAGAAATDEAEPNPEPAPEPLDPAEAVPAAVARGRAAGHPGDGIDVTLSAGETATVHSEIRAPAVVRFRLPEACTAASLRGLPRGATRALPPAEPGFLLARLPPGYLAYQLLCAGKRRARGTITLRGDTGLATLPRRPPRNRLDADGRRYTVLFQNRLPTLALSWPKPPAGPGYVLHILTRGHARTLPSSTPSLELPSGTLPEGEHTLWWSNAAGRRSPTTTLAIRFDNAATTAEIQSPRPRRAGLPPAAGAPPPSTLDVAGTTLPGSRVTVDDTSLPIDAQGRFRAAVALPAADLRALAIRIEHRRSGIHYYLRHLAGR